MATKMSEDISTLFSMMQSEFEKQTAIITKSVSEKVSENIMQKIEEKIKPLLEENENLKSEIETLHTKINFLENMNRKNNIIFHGLKETENNYEELSKKVSEIFSKMDVRIADFDINRMYRIGKQTAGKSRPIIISFTTFNKKLETLRNKKKVPENTYITEDFSKETLVKRKELQQQVKQERENGNEAYIKNNTIVVRQKESEKRKRDRSASPRSSTSTQGNGGRTILAPAKLHRTDAFEYMRARSHSLTEKHSSKA